MEIKTNLAPTETPDVRKEVLTEAFIALGSNLEDPRTQVALAISTFKKEQNITVLKVSETHRSPPMGPQSQPDFMNAVIQIKTSLPPLALLHVCQNIEQQMGRKKEIRWGPRIIDCDIVLYGDIVLNSAHLTLPHPGILSRPFVYEPLLSIAPNCLLPTGEALSRKVPTYAV